MLLAYRMEPGTFWLLIGAFGATTLLLFRVAARRRRGLADERTDGVTMTSAQVPRSIERWEAELHEFTREAEARLDNKIAALQELLAAAERRIEQLEQLGTDIRPATMPVGEPAPLAGPHFGDAAPRRNEQAAVFAMQDAGHGAATIANRLQLPIGEVELMLSLRTPRG